MNSFFSSQPSQPSQSSESNDQLAATAAASLDSSHLDTSYQLNLQINPKGLFRPVQNRGDLFRNASLRVFGIQTCFYGLAALAVSSAVSLKWGRPSDILTDLIIAAGNVGSLAISFLKIPSAREPHQFNWWPAYLGLWLGTFTAFLSNGGLTHPIFGAYFLMFFIAGIFLQNLVSTRLITIFSIANLLGWILAAPFLPVAHVVYPPQVLGLKLALILSFCYVVIHGALRNTEALATLSHQQAKKLGETQAYLTHSVKMAELGGLVATVAHELAQPVQVISDATALLLKGMRIETALPMEKLDSLASRIENASSRLSRLLIQFRDFSRKEPLHITKVDLCEVLRSVHLMTEYDLRARNIRFDLKLPDRPVQVRGDYLRLQQILFNLINNARDACLLSTKPEVLIDADENPYWARFRIRNTGPEIPLAVQANLFNPYFTTKERGKGTGLGLTVCSQLVKEHRGRILFSSGPDETTFVVDLEKAEHEPRFPPPGQRREARPESERRTGILA